MTKEMLNQIENDYWEEKASEDGFGGIMYTVYMHKTPSNKVYIGITKQDPLKRWNSGNGYRYNHHFFNAIKKYGWSNIKHIVVYDELSKSEAENAEIYLISKYNSNDTNYGYNIAPGGNAGGFFKHHSEETKKKISEKKKGKPNELLKGRLLSIEHKNKLSEAHKNLSKEAHENMSKAAKNRKNLGNRKGSHHTEETKEKLRKALGGKNHPNYGKHLPESQRMKMGLKKRKRVICVESGIIFESITEAADVMGLNRRAITKVCKGQRTQTGGFHWKYVS